MVAICKSRKEATEQIKPADTLILDFQPPELWYIQNCGTKEYYLAIKIMKYGFMLQHGWKTLR